MLLYGAETGTLLNNYVASLRVFERKVLRKIFGPVRVGDGFCIRYNSDLYELLSDLDVVQCINIHRRLWLGHVVRMEEDAPARWVFDAGISYPLERPNRVSPVIDWRRRARSRGAWKDVLRLAEIR